MTHTAHWWQTQAVHKTHTWCHTCNIPLWTWLRGEKLVETLLTNVVFCHVSLDSCTGRSLLCVGLMLYYFLQTTLISASPNMREQNLKRLGEISSTSEDHVRGPRILKLIIFSIPPPPQAGPKYLRRYMQRFQYFRDHIRRAGIFHFLPSPAYVSSLCTHLTSQQQPIPTDE